MHTRSVTQNERLVGGGEKWSDLTKEQNTYKPTHTHTHTLSLTERKRVNSISQNNLHLAPALKTHQMQTHLMAAFDDKWHSESILGLHGKEQLTDKRIHPAAFRAL